MMILIIVINYTKSVRIVNYSFVYFNKRIKFRVTTLHFPDFLKKFGNLQILIVVF